MVICSSVQKMGTATSEMQLVNCLFEIILFLLNSPATLKKLLNCQETKINCLFLVGPSNSRKSFIAQSISSHFIKGYASCANSLSEFPYDFFLNKSLVVLEEPLAGANIQVGNKYMSKQDLCRTPILMIGNHNKLGKG